jgi:hypothetical protein
VSAAPSPAHRPRLHYAWIVVGITFLVLLVAAGVRAAPGVLIRPLDGEFGRDRGSISSDLLGDYHLVLISAALPGFLAAALTQRISVGGVGPGKSAERAAPA